MTCMELTSGKKNIKFFKVLQENTYLWSSFYWKLCYSTYLNVKIRNSLKLKKSQTTNTIIESYLYFNIIHIWQLCVNLEEKKAYIKSLCCVLNDFIKSKALRSSSKTELL